MGLTSYRDVCKAVREILIKSRADAHSSLLDREVEYLVRGLVHKWTGQRLSPLDLYATLDSQWICDVLLQGIKRGAQQRLDGVPLAYIVGTQAFLEHDYQVGPGVLIPRPETEGLCRVMIDRLKVEFCTQERPLGMEVGLGSGVLSIEMLLHFPKLKMVATELSLEAKHYALLNIKNILNENHLKPSRLEIRTVDHAAEVLEPFERGRKVSDTAYDFLVSNPPYLVQTSAEVEAQVMAHEPHVALFPSEPLFFYRKIAHQAATFLTPKGLIFLEIAHERAKNIQDLFSKAGWQCTVQKDLTGRDRILIAQRS